MRTTSEIIRRIEQCEFRSKEYQTKAARCKNEDAAQYWYDLADTQEGLAYVLKWVLNDD